MTAHRRMLEAIAAPRPVGHSGSCELHTVLERGEGVHYRSARDQSGLPSESFRLVHSAAQPTRSKPFLVFHSKELKHLGNPMLNVSWN